MSKVVKVGVMPGRIQEVAIEEGASIASVLEIAGLSASGYEIKMDGTKVSESDTVTSSTNLILLAKQVKGNADVKTVKVGQMPGRIQEFGVEVGTPINDLIALADLDATGYEVKVDGVKVDPSATSVTSSTNLVLLAKTVKGN